MEAEGLGGRESEIEGGRRRDGQDGWKGEGGTEKDARRTEGDGLRASEGGAVEG